MAFEPSKEMIDANLRSMTADLQTGVKLPRLSAQERYYVAARVGGLSLSAAAREVGIAKNTAVRWERREDVQEHLDHYMEEFSAKVLPRVQFSTEQAHQMYMNAYHSAGTSAEMTRATDSLVKLHRLLDNPAEEGKLPSNSKQLETLDTQTLLRYAAIGMDTLRPGEVYDGELEDE